MGIRRQKRKLVKEPKRGLFPIRWTRSTFVVVDSNQPATSALAVLRVSPVQWVVVLRRDLDSTRWYVYSREEFLDHLGTHTSETLDDILRLQNRSGSHAVETRGQLVSPRYRQDETSGRAVLVNKKTNRVSAIGRTTIIVPEIRGRADLLFWRAPSEEVVKKRVRYRKKGKKKRGGPEKRKISTLFDCVQVMFVTDREIRDERPGYCKFTNNRSEDGRLKYGICEVSIPKRHKVGELESPSWFHLQFRYDPKKHITILRTSLLEESGFFSHLRRIVQASPQRDIFIFVHGYNVTFQDAARRTAQLAYDLKFPGAPVLYSWPSVGKLSGYMADEATVEVSAAHFESFVRYVGTLVGAQVIHIIAHSMGNRAVLLALERLAGVQARPKINNVILTAPDIDVERFYQIASAIRGYPGRTTLYASSYDRALRTSQRLHQFPRAGESGYNIVIASGVDTIDASSVDTNLFSMRHNYFGNKRTVLSDISGVLKGEAPGDRFELAARNCSRGQYWEIRR